MTNAVQSLSNTSGLDNHMMNQVGILLRELCRLHGLPEPPDVHRLSLANLATHHHLDTRMIIHDHEPEQEMDEDEGDGGSGGEEDDDDDAEEDLPMEMEDVEGSAKNQVRCVT